MKDCCYYLELIQAEIDREIETEERTVLHRHLEKCSACSREYIEFIQLDSRLKDSFFGLKTRMDRRPSFNPFQRIAALNYWKSRFSEWGSSIADCLKLSAALVLLLGIGMSFLLFAMNFTSELQSRNLFSLHLENQGNASLWIFRDNVQRQELEQQYRYVFGENNGKL